MATYHHRKFEKTTHDDLPDGAAIAPGTIAIDIENNSGTPLNGDPPDGSVGIRNVSGSTIHMQAASGGTVAIVNGATGTITPSPGFDVPQVSVKAVVEWWTYDYSGPEQHLLIPHRHTKTVHIGGALTVQDGDAVPVGAPGSPIIFTVTGSGKLGIV